MTRTDDADPDPFQPVGVITGWIAIGGWLTGCPVRLGGTGVYTVRGPSGPLVHPASKTSDKPIAPESNVRVMATFLRDPSRDETNCRSTFDRQNRPLDIRSLKMRIDGIGREMAPIAPFVATCLCRTSCVDKTQKRAANGSRLPEKCATAAQTSLVWNKSARMSDKRRSFGTQTLH